MRRSLVADDGSLNLEYALIISALVLMVLPALAAPNPALGAQLLAGTHHVFDGGTFPPLR